MVKKAASKAQSRPSTRTDSTLAVDTSGRKKPSRYWSVLPPLVQTELSRLSSEDAAIFDKMYSQGVKSVISAYLMWLLVGLHHAYQGKWAKQIVFWLSCTVIIGLIWWIVDFFILWGTIRKYNQEYAVNILRDIKQVRV